MVEKQQIIISYLRQGKSQRQIAKELHISRKTVRRYISEYEKEKNNVDLEA
jgi:DNA-binding NarL/FixJ family response regulator